MLHRRCWCHQSRDLHFIAHHVRSGEAQLALRMAASWCDGSPSRMSKPPLAAKDAAAARKSPAALTHTEGTTVHRQGSVGPSARRLQGNLITTSSPRSPLLDVQGLSATSPPPWESSNTSPAHWVAFPRMRQLPCSPSPASSPLSCWPWC